MKIYMTAFASTRKCRRSLRHRCNSRHKLVREDGGELMATFYTHFEGDSDDVAFEARILHPHGHKLDISAFQQSTSWRVVWYMSIVLSCGITWMLKLWKPFLVIRHTCKPARLEDAEIVVVYHEPDKYFEERTFKVFFASVHT